MSSARSMWSGFLIFIICAVVGVVMFFGLGLVVDNITDTFYTSGFYRITDPNWDSFYEGTTEPTISIFYMLLYLVPVLGLAVFIFSIFRRYWQDRQ